VNSAPKWTVFARSLALWLASEPDPCCRTRIATGPLDAETAIKPNTASPAPCGRSGSRLEFCRGVQRGPAPLPDAKTPAAPYNWSARTQPAGLDAAYASGRASVWLCEPRKRRRVGPNKVDAAPRGMELRTVRPGWVQGTSIRGISISDADRPKDAGFPRGEAAGRPATQRTNVADPEL
jgi:hypothetical protein